MTEQEQFIRDAYRAVDPLYDTIDLKTGQIIRPAISDEGMARAIKVADRALRFRRYMRRTQNSTSPTPKRITNP